MWCFPVQAAQEAVQQVAESSKETANIGNSHCSVCGYFTKDAKIVTSNVRLLMEAESWNDLLFEDTVSILQINYYRNRAIKTIYLIQAFDIHANINI